MKERRSLLRGVRYRGFCKGEWGNGAVSRCEAVHIEPLLTLLPCRLYLPYPGPLKC